MTAIDLLGWLSQTSLAISLLVLLVLLIRKPFAKAFGARAAYALWLAPAIRLFLPELKLLPAPALETPALAAAPANVWPIQAVNAYGWEAQAGPAIEFVTNNFDWLSLAAAVALVLWATIAFAWFSLKLETQSKYMRVRLQESEPASQAVMTMAKVIADDFHLPRMPQVRFSNSNEDGPCLAGLIRPVIFLPAGFERDFTAAEQRLVLAHEIAHLARGDMAATLAALALQAAQWPNPLAHFSLTAFRTDQEAACDAFVLARCAGANGAAGSYASAILKSIRAETKSPAFGLALAHPVKERLMLLKSQKKSPFRLIAGAMAAVAFTTVSLAATASYGFAEKSAAHGEKRVKSQITISVDDGEKLEVPGYNNAKKIDVANENGVRTVKVYGKNNKLLSENVYGPAQTMPFEEVVTIDKDGERRTIDITGKNKHAVMAIPPIPPVPGAPDVAGSHRVMVVTSVETDDDDSMMAHCEGAGEGAPMIMEWRDEDTDADQESITHEVMCVTSDDADAEISAEALRSMIARMEAEAKRDAERREAMIARMREQLKQVEKNKK